MTQRDAVLAELKRGWRSGLDLFKTTHAIDYRARISELRHSWLVLDKWIVEHNGKRHKVYRITGRL